MSEDRVADLGLKLNEPRPVTSECDFPGCDRSAATPAGMCDRHRAVTLSGTGSWLEAG